MVDRTYEKLNSEFVDNKDAHGQVENGEAGQPTTNTKFMHEI